MDNALEAWAMAICLADDIVGGKLTLKYRKNFVLALHNSIELFIAQILIDNNNHKVLKVIEKKDPTQRVRLQLQYSEAKDINHFLATLSSCDVDKFHTMRYCEMCQEILKLFKDYYGEHQRYSNDKKIVSNALSLLGRLRNKATHFFIDKWTFLTEEEFIKLYNFMIVFYRIFCENKLLLFWGEPYQENKRLCFTRKSLGDEFKYTEAIGKADILKKLAKIAPNVYISDINCSSYEITQEIYNCNYK